MLIERRRRRKKKKVGERYSSCLVVCLYTLGNPSTSFFVCKYVMFSKQKE